MVRIEELTVEDNLEDFYKDKDRFKNLKLLIDFKPIELDVDNPTFDPGQPKYKKKQKISTYVKPKKDGKTLF
jgi:hypothetical protein